MRLRLLGALVSTGALVTQACTPAVGPCDEVGEQMVVDGEGRILYAGQALVNGSCGAGRCHSDAAEGADREGVPSGLDFDLPVGTVDALGRPDEAFLERLRENLDAVGKHQSAMWREVHRGSMPPLDEDVAGAAPGGYRHVAFDLGRCSFGEPLAAVNTAEGRRTLRSWIACGAPVVEASDPALGTVEEGDVGLRTPVCEAETSTTGDLFTRVYDDVLTQSCVVGCHTPGGTNPELDLSTPALAYMALTTQTHSHDHSGGSGCDIEPAEYLVNITEPDESYLLHKLGDATIPEAERRICGRLMPSGQPLLTRGTALVRAWIEAGAPPAAP